MNLTITIITAVAAVAAAVAARLLESGGEASQIAATMAAIERDRRHEELTPEFEITCMQRNMAPDSAGELRNRALRPFLCYLDAVQKLNSGP